MARRRERPRPRGGGGGCGPRPEPGAAEGPRSPSALALGPRRADFGVPGRAGRLLAPRGSGGRNRPAAEAERGAVMELGAVMAVCARVCPEHCEDPRPPLLPGMGRALSPSGLFPFLPGLVAGPPAEAGRTCSYLWSWRRVCAPPSGRAAGPLTL